MVLAKERVVPAKSFCTIAENAIVRTYYQQDIPGAVLSEHGFITGIKDANAQSYTVST
jgi:hypothetical protein